MNRLFMTANALVFSALLILTACTQTKQNTKQEEPHSNVKAEAHNIETWPQRSTSPPRDVQVELAVAELLNAMSLEEKVGQIIQPEIKYLSVQDVKDYHLGSVLNGGGTTPNNDKYATVADWVALAQAFYSASMDESDGGVGIPLMWGSDAVHGNNNLHGATIFPHNIGLGAANDTQLMTRIGAATAAEMAVTGLDWTFGPTVAVARDDRWGRTYESYSEDPEIVSRYAKAMVSGIQGDAVGRPKTGNVIATAKHFLGDGGTTNGVDRGDTKVSEQELMSIHGAGYIAALDSNVLTTMASFNSWNGTKLHGFKYLLTDVLKERMGFDGFVVGDWNGHRQIPGCTVEHCAQAINAGLDMFMVPEHWKALYMNTLKDVKSGAIPMARLDDAVSRILRVKHYAGLFKAGPVDKRPMVNQAAIVGSKEHRSIAREAVRKSLVLLKNNQQILPIKPTSNVLVVGDAADNIGKQSGGWSISWQGTGNTNADFPGGTSIYQGIESLVTGSGGRAVLSENGEWSKRTFENGVKPDVAIVVIGEEPYAEWHGDIANIEYQYGLKTDLALLKKLRAEGVPTVTVFISGRPLWVNKELNASNAFVAAWLPGSEGAGIADVLFSNVDGSIRHDFQGRLSFSWPKRAIQTVLNIGQSDYDPLFAYGYGLSYQQPQELSDSLSESSARTQQDQLGEQWVFVSRSNLPWSIQLQSNDADPVMASGNTSALGAEKHLQLFSVDKVSQEDSRRLVWSGTQRASVLLSSEVDQDLSEYLKEDSQLTFQIKRNSPLDSDLQLSLFCTDDCSRIQSLNKYIASETDWVSIAIPLRCLVKQGADLKQVKSIFKLTSAGAVDVSIADIKLVPEAPGNLSSACEE